MQATAQPGAFTRTLEPATSARKVSWTGRVLSGLALLFLAFDSLGKVLQLAPVIKGSGDLGFPPSSVLGLGIIQSLCVLLYAIPRTSVFGAVLLTGWLGGAIATHLRLGNPLFSHTLFPIYVALFVWGGLYLRRADLRALFPVSR
jgi:hypothetical protein